MDMQNVSNLQIPEGVVRTIHDKDNRLIWGRLNYDTKYAGDTLQNGTPTPDAPVPVQTVTGEQTVTIGDGGGQSATYKVDLTGKNLCNGINQHYWIGGNGAVVGVDTATEVGLIIPIESNTDYTVSTTVTQNRYRVGFTDILWSGSNIPCYDGSPYKDGTSASITRNSGAHRYLVVNATDLSKIQIEKGSTATSYASFYNYELCKIGTYQDYIYKSGDDWYVHKDIDTQVVDTTNITARTTYSNLDYAIYSKSATSIFYDNYNEMEYPLLCTHATHFAPGNFNTANNIGGVFMSGQKTNWWIGFAKGTSLDVMKSDLSNCKVYTPLTTPTDTKITDSTIISQLDAIHEWLIRYGYNATVIGNLPIIIDRTNL